MRAENIKTVLITALTICALVIGIIPWLLLIFEKTRISVKWLGEIYFQRWGWFLVLCFAGYALKEVRSWSITHNFLKVIVVVVLLTALAWALIWFLLAAFGYVISTIT